MQDPNPQISRWRNKIREVRDAQGLEEDTYPDALMLALIDVESDGEEQAHRKGSGFYGLLQIGQPYAIDACEHLGRDVVDVKDLADDHVDPDDPIPDGFTSIELTFAYFDRYSVYHAHVRDRIAALHKGGAGTAKLLRRLLARGDALDPAIKKVGTQAGVPRLWEYVKRFRRAYKTWSAWTEEHPPDDLGAPVCEDESFDE